MQTTYNELEAASLAPLARDGGAPRTEPRSPIDRHLLTACVRLLPVPFPTGTSHVLLNIGVRY
jgi:hypothetical protein